jgi:hypothetical protein
MKIDRQGVQNALTVGSLALVLVLSACGSARGASTLATRAKGSTSTDILNDSGPLDANTAEVLDAYRAGWAAFEHALANASASDPALTATMVAPMLQEVRRNLVGDQVNGIVGRGTVQLDPHVTEITATSAIVSDCIYSKSELVYSSSGKPVPPVTPPEHDRVHATLTLVGSLWKVSSQTVTEGTCDSGS